MAMTENGCIVEFYRDAVQSNFKSAQEGRPIYEEKDFVRITTPGDTRTVVVEHVTDRHQQQFPKSWEVYSRGLEQVVEGTPVSAWNQASLSQIRELAHFNVRTVEHLAEVSDANIQRMGPGYRELRERAKQYLQSSQQDAAATAVARENEEMREQMALMREQIEALKAQAAAQDAEKKAVAPSRAAK